MKRKTTRKARLSEAPVGALVSMPNGGKLRNGGTNRGGPGRPPEAIRARSRKEFDAILDVIQRRRESGELETADLHELSSLLGTCGRYGLGTADSVALQAVGRPITGIMLLPPEEPVPTPLPKLAAADGGND